MAAVDPVGWRRALLIATAAYSDPGLAQLPAPGGDVRELADALHGAGDFHVVQLVNRPAIELRDAIEWFFGGARRNDLLLLYVSGHAVIARDRRLYLATVDTMLDHLRATAVEEGFINAVIDRSRARSIVLILDCVHSGAVARGLTPNAVLPADVEHRFQGPGVVVLTSSTELEYAFEEQQPVPLGPVPAGSQFTRWLVEGLTSGDADRDGDGAITVDELYAYVADRVRGQTPRATPGMAGSPRGEIVIAGARSAPVPAPRRSEPAAPSPPPLAKRRRHLRLPRFPRREPPPGAEALDDRQLAETRSLAGVEPERPPADAPDLVDCTVFAPPRARPRETVFVQVFAHALEQAAEAAQTARLFDAAARPRAARSLASAIPRDCRLTFELLMPTARVDDPVQSLVWRGRPESVQFAVSLPWRSRSHIGTVVVRRDMTPLGHVKFKLDAGRSSRGGSSPVPVGDQALRYRRAFLSYASEDRAKVFDRVQILPRVGVEIFQDLLDLEPGERWERRLYEEIERSDVFLLFWSKRARASKWVRRETRYALKQQAGDDFAPPEICPVIIEGPPVARPWRELAHLHFNDSLIYIKAGDRR
jgi:hypothetical protein